MANMVRRTLGILNLAIREALAAPDFPRTPEPSAEMDDPGSVEGFHRAGEELLTPVYLFNAWAIDALAPQGARVVDLGSGSGQFLAYLAEHRPDLDITGVELSDKMIAAGRQLLESRGLSARVRLVHGDMRSFRQFIDGPIDLVSSIFSLHHLPSSDDLDQTLDEAARTLNDEGAALWIFDHARPRRRATAEAFPQVFTPEAFPAFNQDSCNSLKASWSFAELTDALSKRLAAKQESVLARLLPLYQIHWTEGKSGIHATHNAKPATAAQDRQALRDAEALAGLFARTPGWKVIAA